MSGATSRQILKVYKILLQNLKVFPSKNRDKLYEEVRVEFRANAKETDTNKIRTYRDLAIKGVEQLRAYTNLDDRALNWEVNLEEAPLGGLPEEVLDKKLEKRGVPREILHPERSRSP